MWSWLASTSQIDNHQPTPPVVQISKGGGVTGKEREKDKEKGDTVPKKKKKGKVKKRSEGERRKKESFGVFDA